MIINVVAVCTPQGIVRVIQPTWGYHSTVRNAKELIRLAVEAIGKINLKDTEWTGFTYTAPSYLTECNEAFRTTGGGVYLYPWVTVCEAYGEPSGSKNWDKPSDWKDPKNRWTSDSKRILLTKPSGWI